MVRGKQNITTKNGYEIDIGINNWLPYVALRSFAEKEQEILSRAVLNLDADLDPTILNCSSQEECKEWFDTWTASEDGPTSKHLINLKTVGLEY